MKNLNGVWLMLIISGICVLIAFTVYRYFEVEIDLKEFESSENVTYTLDKYILTDRIKTHLQNE